MIHQGDKSYARYLGDGRCRSSLSLIGGAIKTHLAIDIGHVAIAGDVSSLPAFVADLSGRIQWPTIRSRTIARDMTLLDFSNLQ